MLSFLPAPLVGVIAGILFLLNIMLMASLVVIAGLIEWIVPFRSVKKCLVKLQNDVITSCWGDLNQVIFDLFSKTKWVIEGDAPLNREHWYFVFANHQSWADIVVMQRVFNRKIPLLKFFLKKELLWSLPIGGLACWMLDYPFMKRYSKAYLKKHPEMKQKDLETTQQACNKFKLRPTSVMNFLEGTRFTKQKQQDRSSPYKHLLRPKAGGVAYVISEMENYIKEIVDVTIIYSDPNPTFWRFLTGKISKITVYYNVIPLKPELYGDYYKDPEYRRRFQASINTRWQEKDRLIASVLGQEMAQ